jgi:hypothetical protein
MWRDKISFWTEREGHYDVDFCEVKNKKDVPAFLSLLKAYNIHLSGLVLPRLRGSVVSAIKSVVEHADNCAQKEQKPQKRPSKAL